MLLAVMHVEALMAKLSKKIKKKWFSFSASTTDTLSLCTIIWWSFFIHAEQCWVLIGGTILILIYGGFTVLSGTENLFKTCDCNVCMCIKRKW